MSIEMIADGEGNKVALVGLKNGKFILLYEREKISSEALDRLLDKARHRAAALRKDGQGHV